jgi:hypothetical protein
MDQQNGPTERNKGQATLGSGAFMKGPELMQEQKPAEMPGLTEGRIVHYVPEVGGHRAAIIVRNWHTPRGSCNLQVFLDGSNDKYCGPNVEECDRGIAWRSSVLFDAELKPGTWHWPEKT